VVTGQEANQHVTGDLVHKIRQDGSHNAQASERRPAFASDRVIPQRMWQVRHCDMLAEAPGVMSDPRQWTMFRRTLWRCLHLHRIDVRCVAQQRAGCPALRPERLLARAPGRSCAPHE
jgi:hypothetical protein